MTDSIIKEKTVFRIAEEFSRRLGIPCPEIVTQRSKALTIADWHPKDGRVFGRNYGRDAISINRFSHRGSIKGITYTIAHEFTHTAFPKLAHGENFNRHAHALVEGNLFFRGTIRRPTEVKLAKDVGWGGQPEGTLVYRYGKTWDRRPYIRTVVLDTEMPPEPKSNSQKIENAQARLKALNTRIKRLTTQRKKWERRLKRWTDA